MDDTFEERKSMNTGRIAAAVTTALCLGAGGIATAQEFPVKPVTMVIPSQPGGPNDLVLRLMQTRLVERLGKPVVVEYRPGASLQIGTAYVAKARADGYTLLLTPDPFVINAVANRNLPYDSFRDFAPVTMLVRSALVLGAGAGVKGADLREFIEFARSQRGRLNFASPALGSLSYLAAEEFSRRTGIDAAHIPYKGATPAILGVVTDQAQFVFLSYGAQRAQIEAGKIRPLAVTAAKRIPQLPDVPTVTESALPGFEAYGWVGVFAPAGTPAPVVSRLHASFVAALADPEVRAKVTGAGFEIVASTPQALDRFVRNEYARWNRFVNENHIGFEE
jgi:tripartite-type tricarboxylate transporter receptor subunit TctC